MHGVQGRDRPAAKFKKFFVNVGHGNDTVVNQTNSGPSGAPMFAYGDQGSDTLTGGDGVNDTLRGGAQDDAVRGGNETAGNVNDVLDGGDGADTLLGGEGADELDGAGGNDTLDGGDDRDMLDGGSGADVIDGGLANSGGFFSEDTVVYDRVDPVEVHLRRTDASQGSTGENDTILRVENAQGGDGDDTITGNHLNNNLFGHEGNDSLHGLEGRDVIIGGVGRDTLMPSPTVGFFGLPTPDGQSDIMDCDESGGFGGDGDNSDLAFRVLADGDFVNDCEQVLDF